MSVAMKQIIALSSATIPSDRIAVVALLATF